MMYIYDPGLGGGCRLIGTAARYAWAGKIAAAPFG
jgi:hypothetical protein